MEPVIVFHPQGAIVPGAYPARESDIECPPRGWFWDSARGLLAPAPQRGQKEDAGNAALERLADMEWVIDPLPGLNHLAAMHSIACLDYETEGIGLEALAVARRGSSAVLEISGEVWMILPQELAAVVDGTHWKRSRRYILEDTLISDAPNLAALLA